MPTTRLLRKRSNNVADNTINTEKSRKKRKISVESVEVNDENKFTGNILPSRRSLRGKDVMKERLVDVKPKNPKVEVKEEPQFSKKKTQNVSKTVKIKRSLREKKTVIEEPDDDKPKIKVEVKEKIKDIKEETEQFSQTETTKFEDVENGDSDVEEHNESGSSNYYEELRKSNLIANAKYLAELGVFEAKANLGILAENQKKPTRRGLQEWKPKEKEILPRRASLRIRRMDPEGEQLPELPEVKPLYEEELHERKSAEPTNFKDCVKNVKEEQTECHEKFLTSLKQMCQTKSTYKGNVTDQEKFLKSISKMKITEDQVAKVVPQRIFSMAIHPTESKILAIAGDKWGRVGLWDVESKSGQDGVYCYEPQSRPIYELRISKDDHSKVYTSSYDGTLKCGDLEKAVFTQVYATPENQDNRVNGFDFTSPSTAMVGLSGGKMAMVDFRTNEEPVVVEYAADRYSVKGISIHPTSPNYFLTASKSGTVCLWDTRKLTRTNKKPNALQELVHPKSIDAAVFSPVTGKNIVTICLDDKIRLYNSEDLNDIKLRYSISHNNHTGRWLTNFRPEWHPARDDLFLVGSMKHPRQIELFNTEGKMVKTFTDGQQYLASVCSLNTFHPTRNIVVGGNSSGRVHVFKD